MDKNKLPIAFFDSGVGGISVLREAVKLLAPEDFDGNFRILFNEEMIDFSEPVHFELPNLGELDVMLVPEDYWLSYTTFDRGDPYFQFEAAVSYDWLLENL